MQRDCKKFKTIQLERIKGGFIRVNARLFQDIFDFCNAQNRNGILLFLDFEDL